MESFQSFLWKKEADTHLSWRVFWTKLQVIQLEDWSAPEKDIRATQVCAISLFFPTSAANFWKQFLLLFSNAHLFIEIFPYILTWCFVERKKGSEGGLHWFQVWTVRTLSHIQQICSRRRHLHNYMENLYKWKFDYWIKLKTLWQKEKLLIMSNFSFCHNVFKSHLLQMRQKASSSGKWLINLFRSHTGFIQNFWYHVNKNLLWHRTDIHSRGQYAWKDILSCSRFGQFHGDSFSLRMWS